MPILRSREITYAPTNSASKTRKTPVKVDPLATPAQTYESEVIHATPPSPCSVSEDAGLVHVYAPNSRRSLRLSSKSSSSDGLVRVSKENKGEKGIRVSKENKGEKKKPERDMDSSGCVGKGAGQRASDFCRGRTIGKRKLEDEVKLGFDAERESLVSNEGQIDDLDEEREELFNEEGCAAEKLEGDQSQINKRFSREEKGKDVLNEKGSASKKLKRSQSENERRRFSREEKGKSKLVEDVVEIVEDSELESSSDDSDDSSDTLSPDIVVERNERFDSGIDDAAKNSRMYQFRAIARQNAYRFAHFEAEVDNNALERNPPMVEEPVQEVEDWPGPFSTAMKIIRDRAEKLKSQERTSSSNQMKPASVLWTPKMGGDKENSIRCPPSLQELCTRILVKNADAITSLELVPDDVRHKLSQILCDTYRMNCHFIKLLIHGSPTEIRLRNCSWLTDEQFISYFESCDTNNLVVLQLDLCGSCMADFVLLSTIARSSNRLPALSNLSLTGAYRLTDVGLSALVPSAPALKSINLSNCSFVTAAGIDTLATSLESILRELYIDQCESIDFKLMLPVVEKIKHLDVLSIAENESVNDEFIIKFVDAQGQNIKELILTGCRKLTDSSLKSVANNCPYLCTLGIGYLPKLTDSALGYLSNGCRTIETLKLCRNAFSDDALAAFLETSGEPLKELSLNGLKIGLNTALSLSKHSRKLLTLDLSFCRDLTDEALGLIVDSCLSLKMVKIFGCMQITNDSLNGHSNLEVAIIGAKLSPLFVDLKVPNPEEGPLRYSAISPLT